MAHQGPVLYLVDLSNCSAIRQLSAGLVMPAHDLSGPRRIYADQQIAGAMRRSCDPQIVIAPELRTHQRKRGLRLRPHVRRSKVRIDFIDERFQSARSAG